MTERVHNELSGKGFITQDQFGKIDAIATRRVVSVFYELRTILYLGVLLFTTGAGFLIYQNIGEFGHRAAMAALTVMMFGCFWHAFGKAVPYSNTGVTPPTPWFDYVVLLGSLLFISVLGYLQYQYELFTEQLELTTLITALFFFFVAYRFDHLGVLSLAITALASFWGISVTPQEWYRGDFDKISHLYNTAIIFGAALSGVALLLERRKIKSHFTFTYVNFATMVFFVGAICGLFEEDFWGVYLLIIYGGAVFTWFMARFKKSFLFLLYGFVATYIGTTFFLAETVIDDSIFTWSFYTILSCGGFITFIVKFKDHFSRAQ